MKLNINSKGQIVESMDEVVHRLGIEQRLWLNKVVSKHQSWLYSMEEGDMSIFRIHHILKNDAYTKWDKRWLNTLREMYIESFVYSVNH